ncbi:MAG TPA: hypothetical protein VHP33_33500 [Polyangiaceae bacterium]|nr:hypothetical protein [Polyangiaceae bacterium]
MAKSSKASRSSAAKARPAKRASQALKKAPKPSKAPVRSAPAPKKGKPAPRQARPVKASKSKLTAKQTKPAAVVKPVKPARVAKPAPAVKPAAVAKPVAPAKLPAVSLLKPSKPALSSPLFARLSDAEQRAVKLALHGTPTLIESSPRARDAALFAAAASLVQSPVLVASPLAAELAEQTSRYGLEVIAFGAFVTPNEAAANSKRLRRGGQLLIVVEPARLFDASLRQALAKAPLSLVGVAAAHACSEHAHELSPAYLSLREALGAFAAPVLASCTSTSVRVVGQVMEAIGATPDSVVRGDEQELARSAQVVRSSERKAALFSLVLSQGAPGIVLTATSQEADSVFAELSARGVPSVRAHAGMAPAERSAALARFAAPAERLVLVTQSPHANASGLAGCPEASQGLTSFAPRSDLKFVLHYQAPLSPEQQFEDLAWLPEGAHSLVLADSSDAALVQALLAQQRIKPAAIEAMAQVLAQVPEDKPAYADTLALRAGTSRRSAERVLSAFADRNLIVRDNGQISRRASPEALAAEGRLLSARFAALRAADTSRAELVARYVTSRHGNADASAPQRPRVTA